MLRKTVNLQGEDAAAIQPFLADGPDRQELARMVGEEAPLYSESAALRALAVLGAHAVRERIAERGYENLARAYTEEDRTACEASLDLAAEAWTE
ncbi:MAG: hypothetical protein HY775_01965, partial [Acidobacteria bacterium]|nr:hypothetical protein [Acidobacteriota bacterium]